MLRIREVWLIIRWSRGTGSGEGPKTGRFLVRRPVKGGWEGWNGSCSVRRHGVGRGPPHVDYRRDGGERVPGNGLVAEWLMGDGTRQATAVIRDMPGWSALASVDFNGDGTDDVMWRSDSGTTAVWFMRDGQIAGTGDFGSTAGKTLVAEGDFNGDGIGDLMWRDDVTAQIDVWTFDQNGLLV